MTQSATIASPLAWSEREPAKQPGQAPLPWASLVLSLTAAVLFLLPDVSAWLGFDRKALADGQLWRLATGHWTHWSTEHLGWSLLVFALLGMFWERSGKRRRFIVCTVSSAVLISLAVWYLMPDMTSYRGLSGIDCALVTAVAAESLRHCMKTGQRGLGWALTAVIAGYFLKVFYESTTGSTVFVSAEGATFSAVPLAHLVGGLYGLALGLIPPLRSGTGPSLRWRS